MQEAGLIDGQIQSQDATDLRADIALINIFQLVNKGRLNLLKAIRGADCCRGLEFTLIDFETR